MISATMPKINTKAGAASYTEYHRRLTASGKADRPSACIARLALTTT